MTGKYAFLRVGYSRVVDKNALYREPFLVTVVPAGAASTENLLKKGAIPLGSVVMDPDVLSVYDKRKFLDHCRENFLPVPKEHYRINGIVESDYPVFFKQKYEKGGGVRGLAKSSADIPQNGIENLLFQEYIDSPGTYGVGFIAREGSLLAVHSHYEVISQPRQGGSAVVIESFDDSRLLELTEKIVSSLSYSGWGLAEYKYCPKRKDYVFMEINAKFWASCELAFINEPEFMRQLFDVELDKKKEKGLLFINRAFALGPVSALKVLWKYRAYRIVRHPGLYRSIMVGVLPRVVISFLKKFR